jgi:hypothetical protein
MGDRIIQIIREITPPSLRFQREVFEEGGSDFLAGRDLRNP